jgi:hypothetical protein
MHSMLLAVLFLFQQPSELDAVVKRASDYVTKYEEELGNLIGTEHYTQNVAWLSMGSRSGMIGRREQRRTSSDFLIIQLGRSWFALRKVNTVDGLKVKEETPSFDDAFDGSPAANTRLFMSMKADSTKYNIGGVLREINLPTFALEVLRRTELQRFEFTKEDVSKIDGVTVWEIKFRELSPPTLVHGNPKIPEQELFSRGTFWIEPETGRVLKTEFIVENHFEKVPVKARTVVTYSKGTRVPILVPTLMIERYENEAGTIDCRADYTNFRPFEVDVKFDIAPVKPGP